MTVLSYALVLPLLFGGIAMTAFAATELRNPTLLYGKKYGALGMVVGSASGLLSIAAITVPGLIHDAVLAIAFGVQLLTHAVMLGFHTRHWATRKVEGMSDLVRHHTLREYRRLGFKRAYITAIMGNHGANVPTLRGTHMAYAKRDFLRSLPSPDLSPATEEDLTTLIWAFVRSRDDEGTVYFAKDLGTIFEDVYRDLLYFSGKLTDENVAAVVGAAEVYGLEAAKHAVGGDLPVEYMAALGIEPLPPRRRLWFEEEDEFA